LGAWLPTRSGPGYVNVRCDPEEETAEWRWVWPALEV
jgi:hypothetical protein